MSTITRRKRSFFFGPDGSQYEKFSTSNHPTKTMFRWLFDAQGFLTESDDTSTVDAQGFVKLSSDAKALLRDSRSDVDGFSKVIQAHHIPRCAAIKDDGQFDSGNALEVEEIEETDGYNRHGGSGYLYKISNTMEITSDCPFISISQSYPGWNAELTYDSRDFNSAVQDTQTISDIQEDITNVQSNIATGKAGEWKFYGRPNEILGATGCEFNAVGVGRAAGAHGATGAWVGWVLMLGQTKSSIVVTDFGVEIDKWADPLESNILISAKGKYFIGIDSGITAINTPFKEVGSNSLQLAKANIPLHTHASTGLDGYARSDSFAGTETVRHVHSIEYLATNGEDGGGRFECYHIPNTHSYKELINETNASSYNYHYTGRVYHWSEDVPSGTICVGKTFDRSGGDEMTVYFSKEGDHQHYLNIEGSTENGTIDGLTDNTPIDNRPLSLVGCIAVYVNAAAVVN